MKNYNCSCNCALDDDDNYDENDWMDACDHDELSCEDGDDDHWNGDLG